MSAPPVECIHFRPADDHDRVACNAATRVQGAEFGAGLGVCSLLAALMCLSVLSAAGAILWIGGSLLYSMLCVAIATSGRRGA